MVIYHTSMGCGDFESVNTSRAEGNGETPAGGECRMRPRRALLEEAHRAPAESVQMWNRPDRHDQHKPTIKRNAVFHSVDVRLMSRVSGR